MVTLHLLRIFGYVVCIEEMGVGEWRKSLPLIYADRLMLGTHIFSRREAL